MMEYIITIGAAILMLILVVIIFLPRKRGMFPKEKEVRITVYPETSETTVVVHYEGYTELQRKELNELLMFECLGIQTKIEEYGKDETTESEESYRDRQYGQS